MTVDAQVEPDRERAMLDDLLAATPTRGDHLLPVLQAVQARVGFVSQEAIRAIADAFNAPESVQQRAQLALTVLGPAEEEPAAPAAAPTTQEQPAPAAGEAK